MANVNQFSFDDPVAATQVKRQQAIAEMLRQQSQQPIETNQMAGGYVVPVNPLQNLSKIAQTLMAQYAQKNADKAQETYQTSQREALSRDTQAIIQALQGTPEQPFQADTFDDTDNPFGAMTQNAVAPDRNKAIALALQSQNPGLQNVGGSMLAKMLEGAEEEAYTLAPGHVRFKGGKQIASSPISQREADRPSNLREWDEFQRMTPEEQKRFLEMKRAVQVMNLGGSMAVRGPGGGIAEQYALTPRPDQMPAFKGAQAKAEAEAKAGVEAKTDIQKAGVKATKLIDVLNEAETLLPKATGSLVGAGIAKGKSALGISDESTQANERLRLLAGWAVSNVPRMEGPQSNYDVQNYREMAAMLGDSTKPHKDRLAALNQLRDLQNKYANPGVVGEFVGDPVKIQKDIDLMKDPKMRALAQKALDEQLAKAKQPKTTGGWSIQKVK